ncbi:MAG: molybdopterin molybdotransferase MoeA [Nitrososphaerota archaeon]|nr:molybdopterin molybdotransferase MoeA [Nitrososphaerota archaeon]MDG7022437.1 molybdopterin molybdotransferase MoeA [Nitrososphaerota archaeon]
MSPAERTYTPLGDALRVLSQAARPSPRGELVPTRAAHGRVLARDVAARYDLPREDVSHFDGFAVASADAAGASEASPVRLRLRGGDPGVAAPKRGRLARGEAARVLTGGALPPGADAVVPLEDAVEATGWLLVSSPVEPGARVYRAGADVRRGDAVLGAGRVVSGQDLALLASLRIGRVLAFRRPVVAILPTGSELTPDIGDRRRGRVVESHSVMLERLVEGAGGEPTTLPIVPDDETRLARSVAAALRGSDIVLTLAGTSVGGRDLVEAALRGLPSTTALVHGVRVHRGRVMGFAVVGGKPVVMLPGPVQGALNAFILFGYPLIRAQLGRGLEQPPAVPAVLSEGWRPEGRFKDFEQVVYLRLSEGLMAEPAAAQTEKLSFLASRNAYAVLPGGDGLPQGSVVQARLLPGFSRLDQPR